jgi:adenine-specific DNA methylase
VGADTQRERDTGKAPPTHRLHVWWARRPLTPSRAAMPASLLPADTDPDWSKSFNISLEGKSGGYNAEGRFIGINTRATGAGRSVSRTTAEDTGFHAQLVRKGSKLRLARPDERHPKRLEHPQTEWDIWSLKVGLLTADVLVSNDMMPS